MASNVLNFSQVKQLAHCVLSAFSNVCFERQKAYVGPQTEELISHDIPLVFKRPITKTYKALRVAKRQTSIRA